MTDFERAKELLKTGDYTCVLVKGDMVYTAVSRGISPMLEFISSGTDLIGFSAADKIVGKAAAMLFVLAGVKEVFASVLSKQAQEVFIKHGVKCSCDMMTDTVINRTGNDICSMEKAVRDIDEPQSAYEIIKRTLIILRTNNTEDAK